MEILDALLVIFKKVEKISKFLRKKFQISKNSLDFFLCKSHNEFMFINYAQGGCGIIHMQEEVICIATKISWLLM